MFIRFLLVFLQVFPLNKPAHQHSKPGTLVPQREGLGRRASNLVLEFEVEVIKKFNPEGLKLHP